jgi:phage terminase large subunit
MAASTQRSIDLAAKFIEHTRLEPAWFAREALNHKALEGEPTLKENAGASWELDQFQLDVLEAVADVWRKRNGVPTRINHDGRNYITVRSGHGPGKTHLAALVGHWFNTAFRGRVVCTAPKLAQLRTRLWAAFRKIDNRAEAWYRSTHVIHDTAIYWLRPGNTGRMEEDKDWCVLAETASHPENLAGHHEQYQLVIVEEATGVPEHLYPVIFGALSTGTVQILLMISNPTKQTGTFAASHLKSSEEANYFRYHINLKNARRINRDWVQKLELKYGKTSPIVQIRAHGEFADASPRQLIPTAWVMDAIDREVRPPDGSIRRVRVTVDVADGGEDETVVVVKECWASFETVLRVRRFNFAAVDAVARAADAAEELFYAAAGVKGRDELVVDSLGVGAGARDMLIRRGHRVIEYMGGAGSDNPDRWRNRRVQSYLCLRDALRDGLLDFAEGCFASAEDTDEFLAQLASVELSDAVSGERLEDLVTKTEMKRQGRQSPDIADALAMSYGTQRPAFAVPEGYSLAQALCVAPGRDLSGFNAGGGAVR